MALIAIWVFATAFRAIDSRQQIDRLVAVRAAGSSSITTPDQSLWSPERILAWKDTFNGKAPRALAVLRISRLGLEVPVLEGTDDWTLNRGGRSHRRHGRTWTGRQLRHRRGTGTDSSAG